MKKIIFFLGLITILISGKDASAKESKRINIYYDRNMVCIQRTNKCWSFAKGKDAYPTPTWDGPQYLITHIKNGFRWSNPLTGKLFNRGEHSLGDIWIQFYNEDTIDGFRFGFHTTPYSNIPLAMQESHGCLRMTAYDIREFSSELKYFDEFYIIRDADLVSSYLYNNLLG